MRFLVASVIAAAVGVLLMYAFVSFVRRSSMFFPEKYPAGDWNKDAYIVKASDVFFTTQDNVRLHGWMFRSGRPDAPLIIWFHGNGGNITSRAPVAAELAARGVSVLLFDWRGYGRSEGTPTESALFLDSRAAYQFATWQTNPQNIVLYGESLGGPYAAYMAKTQPARCVIIENSFPSLAALANHLYAPLPFGLFVPNALATTRWLNSARLPVLVMHGRRDDVIPFSLGQRLYDDLRVKKEMLVSENGGHGSIPATEGARYYDTVTRFATEKPQTTQAR